MSKSRSKSERIYVPREPRQETAFVIWQSDEPIGIRVKCHENYAAELEAEKQAAGEDWHDSAQLFFAAFRVEGRG